MNLPPNFSIGHEQQIEKLFTLSQQRRAGIPQAFPMLLETHVGIHRTALRGELGQLCAFDAPCSGVGRPEARVLLCNITHLCGL